MHKPQRCIVCKNIFSGWHFFYPQLCINCGDFNYAKRNQTADLKGFFALVTGARVKIGYAVTLKLLRAGATVIATTRFPHDAAKRYASESDFGEWKNRLHIYGLDLRNIARVERFTQNIASFYTRLDIIINNAAQTIRRPPAFYQHLVEFEALSLTELPAEIQPLLVGDRSLAIGKLNEETKFLGSDEGKDFEDAIVANNLSLPINSALTSPLPLLPGDEQE
ncbi:SDR family NAD(P)-dependent oxidoreductase, partial [Planktothrix sp. FACHB-1355]